MNKFETIFWSIFIISVATILSTAIYMYHWKETKLAEFGLSYISQSNNMGYTSVQGWLTKDQIEQLNK